MEEVIQFMQGQVQSVDGVDMVPLSVAIQAVQTASTTNLLANLDTTLADIHKQLQQFDDQQQ
jgi:hypothetical protein